MSQQDYDRWKAAVLGSGLPLEASVRHELEEVGCFFQGEYEFAAKNENGDVIHRSVDVDAWWDLLALKLDVLAECKYRREGVQWLFLPELTWRGTECYAPITD